MKCEFILAVAGVVLLIYGGMVAAIGSGTLFFMVWLLLGGVCFAMAAGLHTGVIARLPAVLKWGAAGIAGICVLILLVCFILIMTRFHAKGPDGLDAIIVLGAQVWESGPSAVLRYRLDAAADYLKRNPETVCVVSGGQGYNEPFTEAEGMRRYLEKSGIAPERILTEDRSTNTAENMVFSRQLLEEYFAGRAGAGEQTGAQEKAQSAGQTDKQDKAQSAEQTDEQEKARPAEQADEQEKGRPAEQAAKAADSGADIGIVTNNFHMYRALLNAGRAGYRNVSGIAGGSDAVYLPNNILRECLGIVKDALIR